MTKERLIPWMLLIAGAVVGATSATAGEPALGGLDPVRLVAGDEVAGEAELTVTYEGFTYAFASTKTKRQFEKDPGRYAIQNETCPVVPGAPADPGIFTVHDEKIYIFATADCAAEFEHEPERFLGESSKGGEES